MKKDAKTDNKIAMVKDFRKIDGTKNNSPLRGFGVVKVLDTITITGVKLLEFKESWGCEFPSTKGKDKNGNDAYYPIAWLDLGDKESNKEIYDKITEALLEAFKNA